MPLRNLPIKTGHLFLALAAIMFIVTVAMFSGGKKEVPKVQAEVPTQMVIVPTMPIQEGKTIGMSDVTSVKWPSEFLPKGATFDVETQVVGRVALQNLFPGEPIFKVKVSGSNTRGGLPAVIPNGLRAVSIAVTEVKGVAGFVKPGDHVDVLSTFEIDPPEGGDKQRITRTVLQNVLVLASAQTMVRDQKFDLETPDGVTRGEATVKGEEDTKAKKDDKKKKKAPSDRDLEKAAKEREKARKDAEKAARLVSSVTLALTPEQVEALSLAEESGDIRLSLRPETDQAVVEVPGISFDKLLGKEDAPPPPPVMAEPEAMPAAPPMPIGNQVEFIQGTEKSTLSLP